MNYTFKAEEVKCNGIGSYGYQAVNRSIDLILKHINNVREELGLDEIFNMAVKKEDTFDLHPGSRFKDPETVAARLVTGLGNWGFKTFGEQPELIEINVKHILETISKEDAITIVVEAHRDCAGADHWYTFEKQWD